MKSIFDSTACNEVISRINNLTSNSKAEWGKMNVSQMLAHLSQALRSASGELNLKRRISGKLFGTFVKNRILADDKPFGKGAPTDNSYKITDERNFEDEKANVISLLERFSKAGLGAVTKHPHPFFGDMTSAEWDTLVMKHLDHHLRQFGV